MSTLTRSLTNLIESGATRIATSMENAGLRTLVKDARRGAPRGKTKQTSKSLGKRILLKDRNGLIAGKAGVNVGKKKATTTANEDPHSHLAAGGSKPRYRKVIGGKFRWLRRPTTRQRSTGTMPANDFVNRAASSAVPAIQSAMTIAGQKALARETAKLAKLT